MPLEDRGGPGSTGHVHEEAIWKGIPVPAVAMCLRDKSPEPCLMPDPQNHKQNKSPWFSEAGTAAPHSQVVAGINVKPLARCLAGSKFSINDDDHF